MPPAARPARLITLGRLTLLDRDGREDRELATRKRKLALLAVLALSRHPLTRDALVDLFWGDQPEDRARHSLSDALSHLRRVLGADAITLRRSEVALSESLALDVDARSLTAAAGRQAWDEVVSAYGGPFMDAVHVGGSTRLEQWVDGERDRLRALFEKGAKSECTRLFRANSFDECAVLARRWLNESPTSAHAALYRVQSIAADSTPESDQRALEEYERLARLLASEYGTRPDRTVTAAAEEIATRIRARQAETPLPRDTALQLDTAPVSDSDGTAHDTHAAVEAPAARTGPSGLERSGVSELAAPSVSEPAAGLVAAGSSTRLARRWLFTGLAGAVVSMVALFAPRARTPQVAPQGPAQAPPALPAAMALYQRAIGRDGAEVSREEAERLLLSAIRLDTTFALAYRQLALNYSLGIHDRHRTVQMLTKAVQYADRLPAPERLRTLGQYHLRVTHDYGRAGATYRALLDLIPTDARAWNSLGAVYGLLGDRRRSEAAFARSATLDPKWRIAWLNLADARYELGDVAGAWRALDSLSLFFPGHPSVFRRTAALAHSEGDTVRAEAQVRALLASARDDDAYLRASASMLLAKTLWSYGRVREGDEARLRGIAEDRARGGRDAVLTGLLEMAQADLWLRRDPDRATRRVREALAQVPLASLDTLDRPYLELVTLYALLGSAPAARQTYAEYERTVQSFDRRGMVAAERRALGVMLVAEGRAREGIATLVTAHDTECAPCGLPELGWAYERAGQPDSARQVHLRYMALRSSRKLDATDAFHRARLGTLLATTPPTR